MDVIHTSIDNKFRPYDPFSPNVVHSYETQFKHLTDGFTANADQIAAVRRDTYINIINTLCNRYNLVFNYSDDTDLYSAAFYLYDFLVANFTRYIITFYTNFLVYEKDSIYKAFNLGESVIPITYSKKLFKNPQLAAIHGNISTVLSGMSSFDIDLWGILSMIYADNKVALYINSLVTDKGNFFKNNYAIYSLDPRISPELQTQIKLSMQNMYAEMHDIDDYIVKPPQQEE
ncbi:MAG: hypothetical protein IKA36_06690 [Clostridia bacterium]|nr:hypothetical protein [Clostridia bacterium]